MHITEKLSVTILSRRLVSHFYILQITLFISLGARRCYLGNSSNFGFEHG